MIIEVEETITAKVSIYEQMMVRSPDILSSPIRHEVRMCEGLAKDNHLTPVERFRYEDPASMHTIVGVVAKGLVKW
jgi:hypothetical protein